jgi:hypothetical protein
MGGLPRLVLSWTPLSLSKCRSKRSIFKNGGHALHFTLRTHIMALYYDLPVFKDVYKLTLFIYGLTKDFSHSI